jgi:hypothetical protein
VQGQLRRHYIEVEIETVCAHCHRPLNFRLDSELRYQVASEGAEPLLFEPSIDWATFTAPNIIHAY